MKFVGIISTCILVLILCAFGFTFSRVHRESFVALEQPQPWIKYNTMFNRALQFKPPNTVALAAHRSITSNPQFHESNPIGKCVTFIRPPNVDADSQSLVIENDIVYTLKSMCFSFEYAPVSDRNTIGIAIKTPGDWQSLGYLILLNALFIELNTDGASEPSVAYKINTPTSIRRESHNESLVKLELTQVSYEDMSKMFAYSSKNPTYNNLGLKAKERFNIRAYYLDPIPQSSQSMFLSLNYTPDKQGKYMVFNKLFNNLMESTLKNSYNTVQYSSHKQLVEFCKYIDMYYKSDSSKYPVFTVTFSMNTFDNIRKVISDIKRYTYNTSNIVMLLEMYMDNPIGVLTQTSTRNIDFGPIGTFVKSGNILNVGMQIQNNGVDLLFGSSRNGNIFNESDTVRVSLPSLQNSALPTVMVTVSPYSIDVLTFWSETFKSVQWAFSRKSILPGNDFQTLFASNQANAKNTIGNVLINTNREFIQGVEQVALGIKNFAYEVSQL